MISQGVFIVHKERLSFSTARTPDCAIQESIFLSPSSRLPLQSCVQAEADLAVALFQALRDELLTAAKKNLLKGPVLVGVITPYREQVTCIKQTLLSTLGPELAKEVKHCRHL